LLKLCIKYQDVFNMLEKCNGYDKKLSNFVNYRHDLSIFDYNLPKIEILSPGITMSNPGIES
jgi:hypothetical protein